MYRVHYFLTVLTCCLSGGGALLLRDQVCWKRINTPKKDMCSLSIEKKICLCCAVLVLGCITLLRDFGDDAPNEPLLLTVVSSPTDWADIQCCPICYLHRNPQNKLWFFCLGSVHQSVNFFLIPFISWKVCDSIHSVRSCDRPAIFDWSLKRGK